MWSERYNTNAVSATSSSVRASLSPSVLASPLNRLVTLRFRFRLRSHSHSLRPLPRLRQPCVPRLQPYAPGLQSYASRLTCEKNSKISKSSARG